MAKPQHNSTVVTSGARQVYVVQCGFPHYVVCDVTAESPEQAHDILLDHFRKGMLPAHPRTDQKASAA